MGWQSCVFFFAILCTFLLQNTCSKLTYGHPINNTDEELMDSSKILDDLLRKILKLEKTNEFFTQGNSPLDEFSGPAV